MTQSRLRFTQQSALLATLTLLGSAAHAESSISDFFDDTRLYVTAPLRWDQGDWMRFGGTLLAVGVAHEYDDNVHSHFGTALDSSGRTDPHGTRDWAPTAAMLGLTWAYATLIDDRYGYEEGRAMAESALFSAASTTLIKLAAGRKRPFETSRVDDWRDGGASFPSMHVSVTFAVGTVLAESGSDEYRVIRRVLGYGLATATAYSRVHDGVHWLSDTVAAAALGAATARFVLNRGEERRQRYSFEVAPLADGAMLTYRLNLH